MPLGGKYRLIDIPISNCINSELRRIYVLTQFNSSSCTATSRHLQVRQFRPRLRRDPRRPADARPGATGTRAPPTPCARTCVHLASYPHELVLILSRRPALPHGLPRRARAAHRDRRRRHHRHDPGRAPRGRAPSASCRSAPDRRDHPLRGEAAGRRRCWTSCGSTGAASTGRWSSVGAPTRSSPRWASTSSTARCSMPRSPGTDADFGKHVIPGMIKTTPRPTPTSSRATGRTSARSAPSTRPTSTSATPLPEFNFFDTIAPIYTHARFLPASKINGAGSIAAVISDGCIIDDARHRALARRHPQPIEAGATIRDSLVMGARLLRDARPGRRRRRAADRASAKGLHDRARDHRQERPHRRSACASRPTESRPISTGPTTTFATASWSCRRAR